MELKLNSYICAQIYKPLHFVSPFLLENVMPSKYSVSSPTYLSPFAIREGHHASSAKEDRAAVMQVTSWLKQEKAYV